MRLKELYLTKNDCYKAGKKIKPKGIMVHSTGANNPTLKRYVGPNDGLLGKNKYNNHWNQPRPGGRQVCVHAFIGKLKDGSIATYQTLPWNHRGWHAGGKANDTHIGFEICEDDLTDRNYLNKVYKEAIELCAYLCKKFNLTEKNIIGHYEGYRQGIASNHGDPRHWFSKHGKSMDTFRADVKKELEKETTPSKPTSKGLYKVQIGAYKRRDNANRQATKAKARGFDQYVVKEDGYYKVQIGAYSNKANADAQIAKAKKAGFDVYIVREGSSSGSKPKSYKVGEKVKIKSSAKKYATGETIPGWVKNRSHTIQQIKSDRILLKEIVSWVKKTDIK